MPETPPEESVAVEVLRSGGLGGFATRARLAARDLPPAEARALVRLVDDAGRDPASRTAPAAPPGAADLQSYRVTVTRGGHTATLTATDLGMGPGLRALVQHVLRKGAAG